MAVITPQTDLYLLKTPLTSDNNNQLTFSTSAEQFAYFNNLPKIGSANFSYQRKDDAIRFPAHIDTILPYNYCMYRNDAYSDKWFYAFITRMEYINDGTTLVYLKTDVWQTWLFDFVLHKCFVEREHVNNDAPGANTLPEGLELGDYVKNSGSATPQVGPSDMWYAVGVSGLVGSLTNAPSARINGLPNGLFYVFADSVTKLHEIAQIYDDAGKADAIYSMFIFPTALLGQNYQTSTWTYSGNTYSANFDVYVPTSSENVGKLISDRRIYKPTQIGLNYTPRNKKLLSYPFVFFNISNNAGTAVTYRYEDFTGDYASFDVDGVLNAGCSIKMYPKNYKNMDIFSGDSQDNPYDYGVNGGKYPTISWNSDSFTNWLTQNAVNIGMSAVQTTASTMGGLAAGNTIGAGLTFFGGVASAVSEVYRASLMPNQVNGNTNSGDLNFVAHRNKFTIFEMSIKPEYARVIDDYFDMFGYKVNRLKLPNLTGRENWNFVKTVNCDVSGELPQEDLDEIRGLFDNGITLWHNPQNFMNYSANNSIIP